MDYKEYTVDLQIKENHINIIRGIQQYDGANKFNIRMMDGTDPLDFTAYTDIEVFIKKPDGTFITDLVGERLQVVDPSQGKISFLLSGSCTLQVGMHFMTVRIYDGSTVLSTARLNYYVQEANAADVTEEEIQAQEDWNSLIQLIARCSSMLLAEQQRQIAEQGRVAAENGRVSETTGIIAQALQILAQAQGAAETAHGWANAAGAEVIHEEDLPVVTHDELAAALATIDGDDSTIKIKRGALSDIGTLAEGELYYATDTGGLYVGTALGNVEVNKRQWVADAEAPVDTDLLWIDTANDNSLKFYDGESWVSTAHLTFA